MRKKDHYCGHRAKAVYSPFLKRKVWVDVHIARLVRAMWAIGVRTTYCCEEYSVETAPGMVLMYFSEPMDFLWFYYNASPKPDSFNRGNARTWSWSLTLGQVSKGGRLSTVSLGYNLTFPKDDVPEVLQRMLDAKKRGVRPGAKFMRLRRTRCSEYP